MNILQVCAYAAPYAGNFIQSLFLLENQLQKLGHKTVYAFCVTAKDQSWCKELCKRTTVYFLPLRYARINPCTHYMIRRILVKERIDIVHSHFELYDLPLAIVKTKKCKMFWHLHDTIANGYDKLPFYRKRLFKLHYKTFSKQAILLSVSEKHMNFAVQLGFNKNNAHLIYNGIDFTKFDVSFAPEKKYDFLIFAWDFRRKGGDIAIQAAKKLAEEGYIFSVSFVGNDVLWKNSIIADVINEPWFIKQDFVEDVADLYNKAKCFLHISRAEGCSYALLEAAYCGLPVIASNISENLFAKNIPLINYVVNESVSSVAEAMKHQIEDGFCVTKQKEEESKKLLNQYFSLHSWANQIVTMYENYGGLE